MEERNDLQFGREFSVFMAHQNTMDHDYEVLIESYIHH